MARMSYKKLQELVNTHNANWTYQIELHAYNGFYHILSADSKNILVEDESPQRTWDKFYIWRDGYCTALNLVRDGKVTVE